MGQIVLTETVYYEDIQCHQPCSKYKQVQHWKNALGNIKNKLKFKKTAIRRIYFLHMIKLSVSEE
jgi:hypothetical protein